MNNSIINLIPNIKNKSYLELGVGNGRNFDGVLAVDKTSVDVNGLATFTGTTDEFFASTVREWDIIFIDANHDYNFVLRDFNNSVARCKEWIAIHDLIPPSEKYAVPRFCGDGFRLLYYILTQTGFAIYPMSNNFGFTLVRMPACPIAPPAEFSYATYGQFRALISKTKLYDDNEIIKVLNR